MDHPGNPVHEGTSTAVRGLAELAIATAMLVEYLRRSGEMAAAARAHRELEDATRAELYRRRWDAEAQRWRSQSASQWRLGLDRGWLRTATVDEVVHVWAHSLPWQREDVRAMQARRRAEERLDRLDPDLMRRYRRHLAEGTDPLTAMMDARRNPSAPAPHPTTMRPEPAGLAPAPEPWEAGPVIAGALEPAATRELEPAPPWPMGPVGWADAERARRAPTPGAGAAPGEVHDIGVGAALDEVHDIGGSAAAHGAAGAGVPGDPAAGGEPAQHLARYASSVAESTRRPFSRIGRSAGRGARRDGAEGDGTARVRRPGR